MGYALIIFLLLAVICMLLVGIYFIYTNGRPSAASGADQGVRIVGSSHSIVSVRKVADSGVYEIKVDDAPMVDMYDEGEFLCHEESPLDRWLRSDISLEERRLLHEELKQRYGIDMGWTPPQDDSSQEDSPEPLPAEEEEEVHPETLMPVRGSVNRFEGYDPFGEESGSEGSDDRVEVLMRFVIDNYNKGLLKPEIVVYAQDRYGSASKRSAGEMGVDIERLRREQDMTGARVDPEIADMPFEAFDMYVHDKVATAAVSEVMPEVQEYEPEDDEQQKDDAGTDADGSVAEDWGEPSQEHHVQQMPETVRKSVNQGASGYSWDDLGE